MIIRVIIGLNIRVHSMSCLDCSLFFFVVETTVTFFLWLMSSKVLNCAAFRGNNPLTGEIIWNHHVSGGSEAIKEKLKSLYLWDGSSNIATIAAKLKDEKIESWHLYLFGRSKGVKMEAGSFFLDQDEGNTLRIQEIDLDTLIFRGSLISSWLTPEQFNWEYRLPHETEPHKYHKVCQSWDTSCAWPKIVCFSMCSASRQHCSHARVNPRTISSDICW